jgi:hypothetical protein
MALDLKELERRIDEALANETPESLDAWLRSQYIESPSAPTQVEDAAKYMDHLPTCNIQKDWTEAQQAMEDTPSCLRDHDWDVACEELKKKMNTCTCGLDALPLIALTQIKK